jgi:hypothetical protein
MEVIIFALKTLLTMVMVNMLFFVKFILFFILAWYGLKWMDNVLSTLQSILKELQKSENKKTILKD